VKEWTPTLLSELPFWELESWWTLEFLKGNYKGQNSFNWRFPYTIGKLLKCKCLTWARMTHLDIQNTSYGQKKVRKSNCQFDFRPLKVRNCPSFHTCKWCVTYYWKTFDKGYNFALHLTSIRGLHIKLRASKVARIPNLGVLRQNDIWVLAPWPGIKNIERGKGGGFPKVRVVGSFWVCVCPWLVRALKVLQLCTSQLVV
jgi:hypothetical protein